MMLDNIYRKISKLKFWVDKITATVCIAIVAIMLLLVTYQVVVRYLFNNPSTVSEVLSRYLFIWLILFAGAYVFGLREHMAIPYVKEKFSDRVQIYLEMFTEVIIVIFAVFVMIYGGYSKSVRQMWQADSALNIPMGVIYSAIPFSGCLIVFYFFYNQLDLLNRLRRLRTLANDTTHQKD